MKVLSRDEMKKVMGGSIPSGAGCKESCFAYDTNTQTNQTGTCSSDTVTSNGITLYVCTCSASGGNCYNN